MPTATIELANGDYDIVIDGTPSTVTVPVLTAGSILEATPEIGDTLTVTGSNASATATFQWQKDGADISSATSASYDTISDTAGVYRRGVSDGAQGPVYTSAVTVAGVAGGTEYVTDFVEEFNDTGPINIVTLAEWSSQGGSGGDNSGLIVNGGSVSQPASASGSASFARARHAKTATTQSRATLDISQVGSGGASLTLHFANGSVWAYIRVDANGRINFLGNGFSAAFTGVGAFSSPGSLAVEFDGSDLIAYNNGSEVLRRTWAVDLGTSIGIEARTGVGEMPFMIEQLLVERFQP
ncbi:hypothetical protein [Jannaschia sp. CCS1]|uniref:hypothetical protein n=1 Tax=Jannaschia sp. (strain CCS1) TaxID=290400 RepID=UPI000053CB91|nr:hypothetical protein [Jannaschia sp. CCS1]ABD57177.1 hypothetical protein Jann_4261 [Jannaschia sp. CCS1]